MSSMVRLTISSSLGGKEQLSQIKTLSFSTVKTNGLLSVVTFYGNLYEVMQTYFGRAIIKI